MARLWLRIVISWAFVSSPLACAELDQVNLRLLRECESPLRWDNVENQPPWTGGVEPVFSRQHRLHLVTLAPGQSMQMQLPPNEMLRLKAISGGVEPDPNAMEIWTSSDDRLFVRANPSPDPRGENLLIAPNANHIVSVRVVHSALADSPVCVSLFVSRHEQVPMPAPYRRSIHVCREQHTICSPGHASGERFFSLSKGQPREFTVEGPCRIACETRLQFPYGESAVRQSYRVRVDCDGFLLKYLEYDVRAAQRQRVTLDGAPANLSRSAWAYFECPEGRHRIRMATDHSLYARVMQQECPDHLLGVNERFTSNATRPAGQLDWLPSFWEVTDEHVGEFGRAHDAETAQEQIALRVARDNTRSGGGLSAWWMMHRVATKHPQGPTLRSVEAKLKGRHTFYRNLLPVASNGSHSFCWYHVKRNASQLQPDDGPNSDAWTTNEVVVGRDHIRDTLRGMASGSFFPAARAESGHPLVYVLPTERGDTQLRVSVIDDREASGNRLFLQYDEGPPIELAMSGDPRPPVAGRISVTEAALSGMWYQHQKLGHGTLGGPFAVGRVPAETVVAATAEIYLPQHVSTVRVWSHAETSDFAPKVSLHVRASKYHRLTESEYLANRRRLRMTPSEIATRLACDCDLDGGEDGYAWRELWNHWRPIMRLLQSHRAVFENGVQSLQSTTEPSNAHVDLENVVDRARRLHAGREWVAAVEAWSQVLAVASFDARREALVSRATALVEAGEHFLAERQMRAAFLFDDDSTVRLDALSWLKERYSEDQNRDSLERLAAVSFLLAPTTEASRDLAETFLQNGRYEYALSAALLADDDSSPITRMIAMRAAARIGWWQTYQRLLRTVREPSEREFWRGVRCVYHGAYVTANEHFAAAGEKGAAYHTHLANAFSIREQFAAASPDDRAVAVSLWREWSGTHPGPYTWEENGSVVEQFGSSVAAYSVNLDAYSQYFRAHQDAPVRLKVCGPTRLKIETRPIHARGESPSVAIDGWLFVSTDGELDTIPITANYPSSTMKLVGTDDVPGQRVEHVVDVPDGVHWIDVRSDTRDVLVRCFVERPEHPITALPPLSVASQTLILEGTFGTTHSESLGMLRMLPDSPHGTVETLAIVRHMSSITRGRESRLVVHDDSARQVQHSDQINEALPVPRVENPVPKGLPTEANRRRVPAPTPPRLVPEHVSWIKTRDISADYPRDPLQQWSSPQLSRTTPRVDAEVRSASHSLRDAAARRLPPVGERHSEGGIRLLSHVEPVGSSASAAPELPANTNVADHVKTPKLTRKSVGRALRQILWQAESNSGDKLPLQIEGASLHDRLPRDGVIEKDYDRLMRDTTWRAFTQFSSSAGIRVVAVPPWSPESPAARARAALLPQVGENERLLSGDDRLVFSLELGQSDEVDISMSLAAIDYLRAQPIDVRILVDDRTHRSVRVDPGDTPIQKSVKLPAGRHSISIGATQRISNHYLRVRLNAANHAVPLLAHRERYYNVATREQPLQLDVAGPARLRIDELRGGQTLTRYVTVKDEVRSITLRPGENEREGLFRVFELISDPDSGDTTSSYQPVQPLSVSPNSIPKSPTINVLRQPEGTVDHRSLVIATPEVSLPTVAFEDLFQLGGQEDATWSLSPGWYQRRPVEEGAGLLRPDEFAELLLTRRFRSDDVSEIARSQVVFRERESAGSTFGIRHAVERPVTRCGAPNVCGGNTYLYVEGTGFVQDTDASLDPATRSAEFSGMLRTRLGQRIRWNEKWSRTQTVTAFARWLSMDGNNYRPDDIDQDVFTPYKSNHPAGFTLADAIWYRPYLDTRLSLRGFATSNEGFDPFDMEVIGFRTGWDQAVGPIELSVNYRLARFLDDRDRLDSFTQHVVGFTALADYWHSPRRRYECGTNVQHNLSASDTSLYFFVSCYFDNGRDYRDYRVGERPFLRLRRLNVAKRPNNQYMFVDG